MKRYYVCRHYIKWKGKLYKQGELLPPEFTDHDRVRNIYVSRIAVKEVPDEVSELPPQAPAKSETPPLDATGGSPATEASAATTVSAKGTVPSGTAFDLSAFTPNGTQQH